jgi:S1-C subfamily serine protease
MSNPYLPSDQGDTPADQAGWGAVPPAGAADPAAAASPTGGYPGPAGDVPAAAPAATGSGTDRRGRRRFGALGLAMALVAGGVGGAAGAAIATGSSSNATAAGGAAAQATAATSSTPTAAALVGKVEPALVDIIATGSSESSSESDGMSPWGGTTSETTEDAGTGMIIASDGLVVTNAHVIAGATTIKVIENGTTKQLPATFVGEDAAKDIALIKITGASDLPTVTLGSSTGVVSGDSVLAIGNALNLKSGSFTVSNGIISGLDRSVSTDNGENLTDMLQTDAAISSGDSGGALVDTAGDVIGMNTASASSSGENTAENIGFAIPVNEITALIPTLEKGSVGTVTYGTSGGSSSGSSTTSPYSTFGSEGAGY